MNQVTTAWLSGLSAALEKLAGSRPEVRRIAGGQAPLSAGVSWWKQTVRETGAELWIGADPAARRAIGRMVLTGTGIENPDDPDAERAYSAVLAESLRELGSPSEGHFDATPAAGARLETIRITTDAGQESIVLLAGVPRAPFESPQNATLDLLLDMHLPVIIRFGSARMALHEVVRLGAGSVIKLDQPVDAAVEIVVNGCVVARGEVIVVQGNYGIRVNEIANRKERLDATPGVARSARLGGEMPCNSTGYGIP